MNGPVRTGILGGTFDPIHLGHLAVAAVARRALSLDRVVFVPLASPAHRPGGPVSTADHRWAMLHAALAASDEPFVASDLELRRPGVSYTADTLRAFHAEGYSPAGLFFVTGTDAFAEIATWREYPALLDLAHFAVCARPGFPVSAMADRLPDLASRMVSAAALRARPILGRGPGTRIVLIGAETPDISSSAIRARVRAGLSLTELVPPDVERYIVDHAVYGTALASHEAGHSPGGPLA